MAAWIPQSVINSNGSLRSLRGNDWLQSPLVSAWVRGRARQNIAPRLKDGEPEPPLQTRLPL